MIVARKAGYSWGAVRDAIRADEELSRMMQDESETVNDVAELTIVEKIKGGDENSAKWWLARTRRTKFGDSVDITSGGQPIKIEVEWRTIDVGQSETSGASQETSGDSI
ncbi:hypothetical protein BECAL_01777 [Bellilinea caldifistulae]|uniref:Uncharacterized protein n=2 Tax=Bellilinea caldifistulae TaxID=360411 RepID=A0A0P6XHK2_9CHLR|nr:hypothetical protein AC812_10660 [Bellilinea caldifistulae]GAP10604.1 hypothetical protein BECAL_01777 [Bellilinea caldifistulae]GIV66670.1 MAG: hypothetical protein KatS3mg047_1063 [Bellilinea sp.]